MEKKIKIVVDMPPALNDKLEKTKLKQMIAKTSIVKLAVNNYCDGVLNG